MTIKQLILSTLLMLAATTVGAQSRCECKLLFEDMVKKVEENYIALALQKETIQKEYEQHRKPFTEKASGADERSCARVLQGFLQFFHDGHLFVLEAPKFGEQELNASKEDVRQKRYDINAVKKYLVDQRKNLNAIEGLWTDGTSTFAVIKNINPAWSYSYVAIIMSSSTPDKVGELKFGVDLDGGRWEGSYFTNSYAWRYVSVTGYKNNTILSIWGGITWGRVDYTDERSFDNLSLYNPVLPSVKPMDNETVLLTIPSFIIEAKQFYSVIEANRKAITEAKNLVIDIRGNTGGNVIYLDLMGLYAERPVVSEIGYALSSPDNIAYFEKFASSKNDPYTPVVDDMKKNPGAIVKGPRFSSVKIDPIKSKIERVVILTDKGNMSAAETFILFSKQVSSKVTTIGSNTGGVVDYNNVNMVRLGCEKHGTMLGYPTYTLHERILTEGYNKTGIKPDVVYEGEDVVGFAVEYLGKR